MAFVTLVTNASSFSFVGSWWYGPSVALVAAEGPRSGVDGRGRVKRVCSSAVGRAVGRRHRVGFKRRVMARRRDKVYTGTTAI
jgi:hypothetical protein